MCCEVGFKDGCRIVCMNSCRRPIKTLLPLGTGVAQPISVAYFKILSAFVCRIVLRSAVRLQRLNNTDQRRFKYEIVKRKKNIFG